MDRKEQIKKAEEIIAYGCSDELRNALIKDFPELVESKDERIRKKIVAFIKSHVDEFDLSTDCWDMLAYLEKQKDASKAIEAVDRIDKYIDEHLANAHDMKDSDPDKKYYRGWDDALGEMAGILQDVYSGEKQKEQPQEELVYRLNGLMQEYIKEGKNDAEKEHRFKCYQLFWDALEDADFFEQKEHKRERNKPKESWLEKSKYELAHEEELLTKRQKELSEIRALKDKEQKPENGTVLKGFVAVDYSDVKMTWNPTGRRVSFFPKKPVRDLLTEIPYWASTGPYYERIKFGYECFPELKWEDEPVEVELLIYGTERKSVEKFRVGDMIISTKNPHLTYKILEVGHINELGNPEYKVEIFEDGKPGIMDKPHNIHYMECHKVDEWGKLIEQKPVEWSEDGLTEFETAMLHIGESFFGKISGLDPNDKAKVKEQAELLLGLSPKVERSEEDEEMIQFYLDFADYKLGCWPNTKVVEMLEKFRNWLESLRLKSLRPQPQGVYKQIVHNIYAMLKDKDFMATNHHWMADLLNDIRVRCKNADECAKILQEPHWKPSEEQMEALQNAERYLHAGLQHDSAKTIAELYEQLKKLM